MERLYKLTKTIVTNQTAYVIAPTEECAWDLFDKVEGDEDSWLAEQSTKEDIVITRMDKFNSNELLMDYPVIRQQPTVCFTKGIEPQSLTFKQLHNELYEGKENELS